MRPGRLRAVGAVSAVLIALEFGCSRAAVEPLKQVDSSASSGRGSVSSDAGRSGAEQGTAGVDSKGASGKSGGAGATAGAPPAAGGADGGAGSSGAGGAGGVPGQDPDEPDEPADPQATFLAIWKAKQAEEEPFEQGPPPGASAPCFECLERSSCHRGTCDAANACIDRHCLCTAQTPTGGQSCFEETYPRNLAACTEACFAPSDAACSLAWARYTDCVTSACSSACL